VVPIRTQGLSSQERKKKAAQGVGLAGAGAATGAATGVATASVVKKASQFYTKSRFDFKAGTRTLSAAKLGQMSFDEVKTISNARKLVDKAVVMRKEAVSMFRSRNMMLGFGTAVSGALLGAGFLKLKEAYSGKKGSAAEDAKTIATAGTAAAVSTYGAYYHRLPVGSLARVLANSMARMSNKRRPFQASWWKG
jgi:hypothetical protein